MKNVKIIIAGVALVAAIAVFFIVGKGEEAVPDTDDTRTQWTCLACQKPFTLTAAEFDDASRKSGKGYLVKCPSCGEMKGVRAAQCGSCQQMFAMTDADGQDTPCPRCHTATVNARLAPEAEAPPEEVAPSEEEPEAQKPITFVQ